MTKTGSARPLSHSRFDNSDGRVEMPTKGRWDVPLTPELKPFGQPEDFIQLTPGILAVTQTATEKETPKLECPHRATHGRLYFRQATIEVPDSAQPLSRSCFDKSDVGVEMPTKRRLDMPFTQQLKPCGQPWDFIQLAPGVLALTQTATAQEALNPVFVHEWAPTGYGVFDEYGSLEDNTYPITYYHKRRVELKSALGEDVLRGALAQRRELQDR